MPDPLPDASVEIIQRRTAAIPGLIADRSADNAVAERGLRRMGVLLDRLTQPQLAYRTIHVAGSKGKGTTTYLASAILHAHGIRTGRYVSPHLVAWNERIAVDGVAISESDFARILTRVDALMGAIESSMPDHGTFNAFELLTATAFVYFQEQQCEFAVVEVGLGGRFDSTNHLHPAATVITRVEAEHVEVLGPTLAEIAWNKAGIIRPSVPAVVTHQSPEVLSVIQAEVEALGSSLAVEGADWTARPDDTGIQVRFGATEWNVSEFALAGEHNIANLGAALIAVSLAIAPDLLADSTNARAMAGIAIPGRFDIRKHPHTDRLLVLDVAHTPESVRALVGTASQVFGANRFDIVLGVLGDKPVASILSALGAHCRGLLLPRISNPRAHSPEEVAAVAAELGLPAATFPDLRSAIESLSSEFTPALVTGSFGIVAETLAYLDRNASQFG